MTEDAALPLLNPESVERYAGRCGAAGTSRRVFSANCRLKLIPKLISVHIKLAQAVSYYEFYTVFPIII
jgi:hypothetical protein